MNQRQATVNAILSTLKESGISYELNSSTPVSEVLTDAHKAKVRDILFMGFKNKQIAYSQEFESKVQDDAELKKYVSGLLNNWIRKAPEFNSNQKYQAKNPGSRQGSQDEQIKEMKKLLPITQDAKAKEAIQTAINNRLAEIKPEKSVTVNLDVIPEELRKALGL